MKKAKHLIITLLAVFVLASFTGISYSWHDETHIAIAKTTDIRNGTMPLVQIWQS